MVDSGANETFTVVWIGVRRFCEVLAANATAIAIFAISRAAGSELTTSYTATVWVASVATETAAAKTPTAPGPFNGGH